MMIDVEMFSSVGRHQAYQLRYGKVNCDELPPHEVKWVIDSCGTGDGGGGSI